MGAWGVRTFDNDIAMDWISELEDEKDLTSVFIKFLEFNRAYDNEEDESVDSDLSSEVLAAAEIVSALLGRPGDNLPPDLVKWLKKKKYDRNLVSFFDRIMSTDYINEDEKKAWKALSKEQKWIDIKETLSTEATTLIDIILEQSELNELWQSSEQYEDWRNEVIHLKQRCTRNID